MKSFSVTRTSEYEEIKPLVAIALSKGLRSIDAFVASRWKPKHADAVFALVARVLEDKGMCKLASEYPEKGSKAWRALNAEALKAFGMKGHEVAVCEIVKAILRERSALELWNDLGGCRGLCPEFETEACTEPECRYGIHPASGLPYELRLVDGVAYKIEVRQR